MNPPPSTLASNGTAVPAAAVLYSQFSDTYKPVPLPARAYAIESLISEVPALPANTGAVPTTATFPVTAAPHVAALLSASAGTPDAHDEPDGSPITIAEYAANCAVVIASHVAGVATVTVSPDGTPSASALDDPPFTLVERISTDCDAACATAGRVTATATDPAAANPAVTATGTSTWDITTTGASPAATTRRTPGSTRRSTRRRRTPAGTPR